MSKTTITHENDGLYRNAKTGKIVAVSGVAHNWKPEGIYVWFRGTRDGKPFGRSFSALIEEFMDRHEYIRR